MYSLRGAYLKTETNLL